MYARLGALALALLAPFHAAWAQTPERLDLSSDPETDYVSPKLHAIYENLGGEVPAADIMDARNLTELKKSWRPTYHSLAEFVASVQRAGWKVAAQRDLADFYVVVLLTPHGNVAAVYYAKSPAGLAAQANGTVKLFLSDRAMNQVIPDDARYDLVQRWRFSARSSSSDGSQGLMPASDGDERAPQVSTVDAQTGIPTGFSGSTVHGWLVYREGLYFVVPPNLKQYLVVFIGGPAPADQLALAFTHKGSP